MDKILRTSVKSQLTLFVLLILAASCTRSNTQTKKSEEITILQPAAITEPVRFDSDDPAIWYNAKNPSQSLILGTDKTEKNGALFAFNLEGQALDQYRVDSLDRPNNVAIARNFKLGEDTVDVAVVAERMTAQLRLYKLPDMTRVDNGGIPVFTENPSHDEVMGVAVYHQPGNQAAHYAIVSRKSAPTDTAYLHQYQLYADNTGSYIQGRLVREFGKFSGLNEIEAIAVDSEAGYVYYSDEGFGIHKYAAHPDSGNTELALFGGDHFVEDHEGIAIYATGPDEGYILVSDQQGGQIHVYPRFGKESMPHHHPLLTQINYRATDTDGIEVISDSLNPTFPRGLLVAMSDDKTFHLYDWRDVVKQIAKIDQNKHQRL